MFDIIVIGAGVSGLIAAGVAAQNKAKVLLLEKMEKPGRKLRITGKGRCNITNNREKEEFLSKVDQGRQFVDFAFSCFDNKAVIKMLEEQGLELVLERGERIFPASGRAQDVANTLENWAKKEGVTIRCDSPVEQITVESGKISGVVLNDGQSISCKAIILATGGVSYSSTGSSGDGHEMAYQMGHDIISLRPSLVPLVCKDNLEIMTGLELRNVEVKLFVDGQSVDKKFGEVTFYSNSIAGPTIIAMSRTAVDAILDSKNVAITIDLKPALSITQLENRIAREIQAMPTAPVKVLLDKLAPRQIHHKVLSQCQLNPKTTISKVSKIEIDRLIVAIKSVQFDIIDYRPFSEAIVTAGGVDTDQVDDRTMQSRKVSNLFFAGELLDIDAQTGGYNIQLALSTGHLAGLSAAAGLGGLDRV